MAKLVKSPEVQSLITREREALEELAQQQRARLVLLSGTATDNVERVVKNPHHTRNVDTSRWVLDRTVFGRSDASPLNVQMEISEEVLVMLAEAIEGVIRLRARAAEFDIAPLEEDPHLIPPPGEER